MTPRNCTPIIPTTRPSPDEAITEATGSAIGGDSELALSVDNRFRSVVLPFLVAAGNDSPSSSDSPALQDFRKLLEDPEIRAVAWEHLGTFGLPADLSIPRQQLLAKTLLPYVQVDRERSWEGLCKFATHAVETGDMKTYELLGMTALNAVLPNTIVERLSVDFAQFETHNVTQVPALAPWMELFIERGNDVTYAILSEVLIDTVKEGRFSSFDHILTVLCKTHQPIALQYFKERILPPILIEQDLRLPVRLLLAKGVVDAAILMPLAATTTYLYGGLDLLGSQATPLLSLALGLGFTFIVRRPAYKAAAEEIAANNEQTCKTPHYQYLLDRCVAKLCALPPSRADAHELLNFMESHPALKHKRAEWRELRAQSSPIR